MVTVVMTTYNPEPSAPRMQYAAKCLTAWHKYAPNVKYLLADDGSPHILPLQDFSSKWDDTSYVTGPHNGIGSSLNRALQQLLTENPHEPWLYTTDDWLLTGPLDLAQPLQLLDNGYDMVRIGPVHPNLECTTTFQEQIGWWLDIHTYLPATGFAFATRPFLAAPSLYQKIGAFREGVDAYVCERDYSDRVWDHGGIKIAAVTLHGPWEHIGDYEVGDRPISV